MLAPGDMKEEQIIFGELIDGLATSSSRLLAGFASRFFGNLGLLDFRLGLCLPGDSDKLPARGYARG